nr:unnamed protein product [Hydra vulgaris]
MQLNSAIPITLPVAIQNNPILSHGNSLYSNSTKNFDKCYFNEENHDGISSSTSSNAVFESSHKPPIKVETYDDDVVDSQQLRETVLQYYYDAIESLKCNFRERLQELYFIQSGGNMVDYPAWKIRPNPHLITFLSAFCLDENMSFTTPTAINTMSPSIKTQPGFDSSNLVEETPDVNLLFTENVSNDVKLLNNGCVIKSDQYSFNSAYSNDFIKNEEVSNNDQSIGPKESLKVTSSQQLNSEIASEDIAGQVKHESDILDRISQLRKNGLWSLSRLPKVCEQLRKKSHWDFLLEEMQWLAADFAQEKKWKRNMGRKISRAVLKYHQDQASQNKRAQNEEKVRLRRIASGISKEVRIFWQQIEKVACYKQQSRQEEQRKKALDLHLNFIVDQTERYSSWLVEGMKESTSSPFSSKLSDNEFEPESDIDDDETTIAEEENQSNEKYEDELEALRRESEMPIEDLINAIPENILTKIGQKEISESESDETSSDDESDEYVLSEDEEDVEDTLDAEEKYGDSNHKEELEQLQRDSELPINELIKLYGSSNNVDDTKATQSDLDSDSNEENDIEK